ncbi:Pfs NACHT and ankyrin domain protein [Penicillium cataractarum]|uniref:Pfs NACHT and ankyrin domain protein n=1 Tax=Penicillium cataractarum TaxID=2100454 RepID=A0A9W9RRA1_9EURO|nr:Pfs NACHT and ankyrin domain protein [Penicillium cataractarum]KAJ5364731.1 Pfs NACHT and ankyrin domain protein [Penicillium cataractarum]
MLDEEHEPLPTPRNDHNAYTLGSICGHNVVIACLPNMGTNPAATVATSMINTFQSIRLGLMVGIGGGIPSKVNLGDVVVSQPVADYHGVVQWDMGKLERDGRFVHTGSLNRPPNALLNASNQLKSNYEMFGSKINEYLDDMERRYPRLAPKYTRRECLEDPSLILKRGRQISTKLYILSRLWQAIITMFAYLLGSWAISPVNEENRRLPEKAEEARTQREVRVHHGLIASGNKVIKDSQSRDSLDKAFGGHLLCVEMEAAGLMNDFPCIVIRGICDYADSGKEKSWQEYASAVAAAYAKELLGCVQPSVVDAEESAKAVLENVKKQMNSVQRMSVAMKANTDSIKSNLLTHDIKAWLDPSDPSTNANHARTLHHKGTGAWLLENPVFRSWYLGSRQHMWLHGLAGCGKTVLSTIVLDCLAKGNDPILNFFFDFSDTRKQTYESMLRSLAFQLYQGGFDSAVHLDALFQAHQNGKDQPERKVLSALLFKMLAVQKRVSIVLDALDESTSRDDILKWIEDIISRPELAHVQLFYTSRPESQFLRRIPILIGEEGCLPLNEQAVNSDIRSWVSVQLSQRCDFTEKSLSQGLLEEIQKKVGDGANGMFRWAFCQLDSLARCHHQAAIEEALASLPLDLNETYQRMIDSIPTDRINDAIRLLQFLVHSKRPLKLVEAKEVIATRIENEPREFDIKRRLFCETDLLDYCPGLAKISHGTDKALQLAHFSVKEYLLSRNDCQITTASISIMKTCLIYLTDIDCSHRKIQRDFPMARFAAEIWTDHAALAQASEELVRMTVNFLEDEETFQRWGRLYQADMAWDDDPGPPRGSRLYYACFSGLIAPARDLIGKGADVNTQGGRYGNALQAASLEGHQEAVKLLLEKGAHVNAQGGLYGNALQAASSKGYLQIVKLLLEKGADINAEGGKYANALQAASSEDHLEIVRLLLNKGADVNAQGGFYGNAIQAASSGGYLQIVKLLLERGADVHAKGGEYGNALQAASFNGNTGIVKLLLEQGAHINAQGGLYGNALSAASSGGYLQIVKLLLEKGADTNAQDSFYGNALQAASYDGDSGVAELLLDNGADVNAQGGFYGNALQAASLRSNFQIVQRLLEKGADVNAGGGEYGNALQAASSNGNSEIVKMLLDKGAYVNAQGGRHGNALQAASSNGDSGVVKLLLNKGADVNAQCGFHGNALQAASASDHLEIVKILLDKGVAISMQGGFYGNALQAASSKGNLEIIKFLIDKGADVNAKGGKYGNALQAASSNGDSGVVKLLLDKGADVNAQGGFYGNALQAASASDHLDIVRLLLDRGADANTQGGRHGNALYAASSKTQSRIIKMLLDKGVDVSLQGHFYGDAPLASSASEYLEIIKILVEKGADINADGSENDNALYAASSEGHLEIVELLLNKGADVNAQGSFHGNALQAASLNDHLEIVILLLDNGADVNAQGGFYGNALQAASLRSNLQIVKLLLEKGADVNAEGGEHANALQTASSRGHQEIVELLLDHGAHFNGRGGDCMKQIEMPSLNDSGILQASLR